jgi:mandelate racemase
MGDPSRQQRDLTEMTALHDLTVRALRVRPLDLGLKHPVETAAGVMRTAPLVLIDLQTAEGVVGCSYVRCYTPWALPATARLISDLGEAVAGAEADPRALDAIFRARFRLLGTPGLVGIAIAAIEMAAWDAHARAAGVPLVELLGGRPRPIPAYAGLRTMSPRGAAEEAGEALARGFPAVKLKIGAGTLAQDIEAIRAVRGSIGDAAGLMVDYNQSLSVEEALVRVRALDEHGLTWIEEPTRADDYAGHARIAAAARTPIQLGENWWGPGEMEKSIAAGASDHVTLDVMKLGGVGAWLSAAALAEQAELPASSHTFPEMSVHLLALTPTRCRLEYLDHAAPILAEPIRVRDGLAYPPARAGSGLEWDEDAVKRWLIT